LRETIFIVDYLCPLYEFVHGAVEISGVIGDSCMNKKPSISSSKKGKTKVSGGKKRP